MRFDPNAYPLADFGLSCKQCGYPLANLTEHVCPECGRAFTLEEYIPDGAMPALFADGQQVRATDELLELFASYDIPHVSMPGPSFAMFGGLSLSRQHNHPPLAVPRERYFEAIDLVRRYKLNEELPPPPEPTPSGPDWRCDACGEENPGSFEVCWNCQAAQDDE